MSSPSTSKDFSFTIYPIEWVAAQSKYCLAVSGIVTTGYTFNVTNGTVTDSSSTPQTLGTFSVSNATGGNYVGSPQITWTQCTFPIKVAGTVTVNGADLAQSVSAQHSLGAKTNSGIPVCYQVSVFNNDAGSDNDWNDLVLNFQLYDSSTD